MYDSDQSFQLETLVYASTPTQAMTRPSLYSLLTKARSRNRRLGITGALLYADQCFVQALEGRSEDLEALLENISDDARHQDLRVLYRGKADGRSFPLWSLGFPNGPCECGNVLSVTSREDTQTQGEAFGAEILSSLRRFYDATQLVAYA